jgi:hypothetical protein
VLTGDSSKLNGDRPRANGDGCEPSRPQLTTIPNRGDRIELLRAYLGVHVRGIVFYADQLQILVKWDDGRSQSLRAGAQLFRVISEQPGSSQ